MCIIGSQDAYRFREGDAGFQIGSGMVSSMCGILSVYVCTPTSIAL